MDMVEMTRDQTQPVRGNRRQLLVSKARPSAGAWNICDERRKRNPSLLTQRQAPRVTSRAWFVMCNQQALGVLQELLLDEAGVPHFNLLEVARGVSIEDDHHPVSVLHQGRPAGLEPATQKGSRSKNRGILDSSCALCF